MKYNYDFNLSAYYDLDDYLDSLRAERSLSYDFIASRDKCKNPMNQLINHFDLAGKTILSIGPNFGHEEYWLYKSGCKLIFVVKSLKPVLSGDKPED